MEPVTPSATAAAVAPNQAAIDAQIAAAQPVSATQYFYTDEVLWYNNGIWGQLGFAVPNFGTQVNTLNSTIWQLVNLVGRNLFAIMMSPDASLRVPPSINTLVAVNQLILRARTILSSRALQPSQRRMQSVHGAPSPRDFLVYPVPFFQVPNAYMAEWAGLVLAALGEAMQHTENSIPYEITTTFGGQFGQYFQRIYQRMAVELFGVSPEKAAAPDYVLDAATLASYNPGAWFTQTELVDSVRPINQVPPGNDPRIQFLAKGIAASQLIGLQSYPGGTQNPQAGGTSQGTAASAAPLPFTGSFAPAPGAVHPSS